MAGEQTVTIAQTTTTTVKVVVNAIGSSGSHVPLVIDTTTTRLDGRSEVPTVYYPSGSTGIAEIRFSVLSSSLTEFTILICKVNGTADSVAFSEYAIPIKVLASEAATLSSIAPNVWGEQESGYTIPIYAGSFGARLADAFDPATDTVARVTLVDTTTTNTDMRGTDGANTVAPDNASITAILTDTGTTIPASISALNDLSQADVRTAVGLASGNLDTQLGDIPTVSEFNARTLVASDYFDPATDTVTTDAASRTASQADVSALATAASIAALNDLSSTDVTNAVWDASVSSHNVGGSFGRGFRQVKEGLVSIDGQVNDLSATSSSFVTNLTAAVDDYYNGQTLHFISGSLAGQSQVIRDYNGTTKTITLDSALTSAPANADEFIVLSTHVHAISKITDAIWNAASSSYTTAGTFGYYVDAQISSAGGGATAGEIADAVWDETRAGHTTAGTFGYYLDDRVSQVSGGGGASAAEIWGALLSDYATAGTFGGRFQEADRYTNTTANIIYVNQGDAYDDTANNAIAWAVAKDYSGADSLTLVIEHRVTDAVLLSHAVTYIDATTLKAYLSSSDTAFSTLTTDADFGVHPYRVEADYSGEVQSAVRGAVTIRQS